MLGLVILPALVFAETAPSAKRLFAAAPTQCGETKPGFGPWCYWEHLAFAEMDGCAATDDVALIEAHKNEDVRVMRCGRAPRLVVLRSDAAVLAIDVEQNVGERVISAKGSPYVIVWSAGDYADVGKVGSSLLFSFQSKRQERLPDHFRPSEMSGDQVIGLYYGDFPGRDHRPPMKDGLPWLFRGVRVTPATVSPPWRGAGSLKATGRTRWECWRPDSCPE